MSTDLDQWLFPYSYKLDRKDGSTALVCRAGETEGGATKFVLSTLEVDRMGDVVEQKTWRLRNYRANPVVLHEHSRHLVIGKGAVKINQEIGRLEGTVTWDASDFNPTGALVAHQHANGFRSAVSVGFRPGKVTNRMDLPDDSPFKVSGKKDDYGARWRAGSYFSHNELLEFSSVAVPANASALQLQAYVAEADDAGEQFRRWTDETLDSRVREIVQGAFGADTEIRTALLGELSKFLRTPEARTLINGALWAEPSTPNQDEEVDTLDRFLAFPTQE